MWDDCAKPSFPTVSLCETFKKTMFHYGFNMRNPPKKTVGFFGQRQVATPSEKTRKTFAETSAFYQSLHKTFATHCKHPHQIIFGLYNSSVLRAPIVQWGQLTKLPHGYLALIWPTHLHMCFVQPPRALQGSVAHGAANS